MIDLLLHAMHFCASCVSDNNVIPPAAGAIGGAVGAVGGLGGLGSLSSEGGNGSGHASSPATGASTTTGITTATDQGGSATTATPGTTTNGTDTGGDIGTHATNPFADESGGIAEHPAAPSAANPSDPFASPQSTPDPLFSDGPQVDGSSSPGDDSAQTDYINPDGTPLGSSPAAPPASRLDPHTGAATHGLPHKPNKP